MCIMHDMQCTKTGNAGGLLNADMCIPLFAAVFSILPSKFSISIQYPAVITPNP